MNEWCQGIEGAYKDIKPRLGTVVIDISFTFLSINITLLIATAFQAVAVVMIHSVRLQPYSLHLTTVIVTRQLDPWFLYSQVKAQIVLSP